MVHTLPPWTSKWRMATIFANIDDAELAARLGSIHTFDRRGDIIWMDDFEGATLKWDNVTGVGTGTIALSTARAHNGTQSVKYDISAGVGSSTNMAHPMALPVDSTLGFEISFTGKPQIERIGIKVYLYTGTAYTLFQCWYSLLTNVLYIVGDGGADIPLAVGLMLLENDYCFHTMKMVADYKTGRYVRVILNDNEYDASAYAGDGGAIGTETQLNIMIYAYNNNVASQPMYWDDFILTQNEP